MKSIATLVLAAYLVTLFPVGIALAEDVMVGYVDTVKIFADFEETIEAEEIFKKEVDAWKQKAEEMEAEISQLREEIQSQTLMLSEDKMAEKKLVFDQKVQAYQKYWNEIFGEDGKAAQRNKELTEPLVEKINAVIAQVAEEEGYTLILDASQGNIIYAKKEMDLTDKIIAKLKEQLQTTE
ncbi:MAG: OmpH family outer membrane protein [Candidatus Krumholzibacteriota bacterium]|nr:OmpH family outer membrane protein [Candidatus Krumholzibacteriota bacterium]